VFEALPCGIDDRSMGMTRFDYVMYSVSSGE
jgi:hypothetical protein